MEKAVEILRIKGMATRDKKSGRSANEGVLVLRLNADASSATVLELNCETDFVAKNEAFIILANDLAAQVEAHGHADLTNQVFHKTGQKVNDYLAEQVTKLGENLKVSRSLTLSAGPGSKLASYVHNGSKIAVVLELAAGGSAVGHAGLADLGRQLAMQVVANGAEYLRREEVSADRLEKERVIAEVRSWPSAAASITAATLPSALLNGSSPLSISNTRTPRAHQSAALVAPSARNTSGARYCGVPTTVMECSVRIASPRSHTLR
jgi:elongation factor Ts